MFYAIAQVVPLRRLPRALGVFDYLVPSALAPRVQAGQIVFVPFRRQLTPAVVLTMKRKAKDPTLRYEQISSIITDEPWLTASGLELAAWVSAYYLQSPALVLWAITPPPASRPTALKSRPADITIPRTAESSGLPIARWLAPNSRHLVESDRPLEWLAPAIREIVARKQQALVVVPELPDIPRVLESLQAAVGVAAIAQPDRTARAETDQFWRLVLSGRPIAVVGTRRAVFVPTSNLGLIVVLDEHSSSLKQWDQNPRYHTREVAAKLAELSGCALIYTSPTPSLESLWRAQVGLLKHEDANTPARISPVLVDLEGERAAKNFTPVSRAVQERLEASVPHPGLQALLLVERKGVASFVRCRDCGYVPRCDRCGIPFRYRGTSGANRNNQKNGSLLSDLFCNRCQAAADLAPQCPHCRGIEFRLVGWGIQRVLSFIRTLLPGTAVARYDADLTQSARTQVIADLTADRVSVLITTSAGLRLLSRVSTFPLVAVLMPDLSLQQSDFRAAERTFQVLRSAQRLARTHFIIQTHRPNHVVYRALTSNNAQLFYHDELANRRELGYPPLCQIITLTCRGQTAAAARAEAERVAQVLANRLPVADRTTELIGPYAVSRGLRRQPHAWQLTLKLVPGSPPRLPPPVPTSAGTPLAAWLKDGVPDTWVIDVDPVE